MHLDITTVMSLCIVKGSYPRVAGIVRCHILQERVSDYILFYNTMKVAISDQGKIAFVKLCVNFVSRYLLITALANFSRGNSANMKC